MENKMIEITFPCGFVLICKNDRQIIINNIKDIINNNWVNYRICFEDLKLKEGCNYEK